MSKKHTTNRKGVTGHGSGRQAERRLSVRGVRRDPPDLKKLARALIELAQAQAEVEARAEHEATINGLPGTSTDDDQTASQEAA